MQLSFRKTLAVAALGLAFAAPQAQATIYHFWYEFDDSNVVWGTLEGTREAGTQKVDVTSVVSASFDSNAFAPFALLSNTQNGHPAIISLDGSFMDFWSQDDMGANTILFSTTPSMASSYWTDMSGGPLSDTEAFNANNWHLFAEVDPAGAVPEPASLALLGLGFAGLIANRRRKTA